jgi:hypothetical protein
MGSKSSSPPSPDYGGLAQQQSALSQQNTQGQTQANRPDVYTPWGSQTWKQNPNDPNDWSTQINLSPAQQQSLNSQQATQSTLQGGAQSLANQAVGNFQRPMDYSGGPQQSQNINAGDQLVGGQGIQQGMNDTAGGWRQQAQSSVEQLQQPQLQQRRSAVETQLANQGITRGSEAWNNEMRNLSDEENRAQLAAISAGRDEANSMFNQDLQSSQFANQAQQQGFNQNALASNQNFSNQLSANQFNNQNRQQWLAEQQQQRSQPLNELNALQSGQQVANPQMPTYTNSQRADTTNLLGAANMGYQAQLDSSNASNSANSGMWGGLFSLGGAALSNPSLFNFSDRRLKQDIVKLFTRPDGLGVYSFTYVWGERAVGVMADEVKGVYPHAVVRHASGFDMVDYGALP